MIVTKEHKKRVISKKELFYRRARSKFVGSAIAMRLIRLEGITDIEFRRYDRLKDCAGSLIRKDNKLISHYCFNRFCLVCNRIRTAHLINHYGAAMAALPDKSFLTLTVKNCKESQLRDQISTLKRNFFLMKKAIKKQYGLSIDGMRKIETTYNKQVDTYHPHLHIIMNDPTVIYQDQQMKITQIMLQKWLQRFPETTNIKAQDSKPATDGDLNEMFKYFTKLISKDKKTGKYKMIPPRQLRVIMRAVEGTRIFQTYGNIRKLRPEQLPQVEQLELECCHDQSIYDPEQKYSEYIWSQYHTDWINQYTGEKYTCYTPAELMQETLIEHGYNIIPLPPLEERARSEPTDPVFIKYDFMVKTNNDFAGAGSGSWDMLSMDRTGRIVDWREFQSVFISKN